MSESAGLKMLYRAPSAVATYWRRQATDLLAEEAFRQTLRVELFDHSWIITVRAFLEEGRIADGARVLEVGCGWGRSAVGLLRFRPRLDYVGIDLVKDFLDRARAVLAEHVGSCRADLRQAEACALPFPDASFEAVVTARVLQYVADPARALGEAWRVLRPGGRMVVIVPSGWNALQRLVYYTRLV